MAKGINVGKTRLRDYYRRYEETRSDARRKLAGIILGALMDGVHVYVLTFPNPGKFERERGERYIKKLFKEAGSGWKGKDDLIHVQSMMSKVPRGGFGVFLDHLV